jgi:Phosphate-starvation-inducible E family
VKQISLAGEPPLKEGAYMSQQETSRPPARAWVARAFTGVEDIVYIGLGLLLAGIALYLLVNGFRDFGNTLREHLSQPKASSPQQDANPSQQKGTLAQQKDNSSQQKGPSFSIIKLLDHVLLILLIVELLYTVQVSFREHALVPEPFLLVGLISAIRRVLILTAEFGEKRTGELSEAANSAQDFFIELGVLTVLILALSISLVLLRKTGAPVTASRA